MSRRLAWFLLAVLAQCAILAAVPGRQVYTRLTGKPVTIRTAPVDPYSFLSGYHVTLNYEISRPWNRTADEQWRENGQTRYVLLERGEDDIWSATSMHEELPEQVRENAVMIKGRLRSGRILFGIEAFYIPEDDRQEVEQALRASEGRAKAEIKVDRFGHAALERLIIDGKPYEY